MPRDLPGLYWDAERNRYFPASSRPPQAPVQENPHKKRKLQNDTSRANEDSDKETAGQAFINPHARRRTHVWSLAQSSASSMPSDWTKRERIMRNIQSPCIGATSRLTYNRAPVFGKVTTFCVSPLRAHSSESKAQMNLGILSTQTFDCINRDLPTESSRWHLLGDSRGWLFRCKASYSDHDMEEPSRLDSDVDVELNWLPWTAELNLQPNGCVSSLSTWGSRWVATSGAGTSARFASSEVDSLDRMFIVTLPGARDLWASHLRERSVVFGASFRAIYVPDIEHSTTPEQLNTSSDVFTVTQDQSLIYTGARNGSIHRFDKRIGFRGRGELLLDSRFSALQRSSVLNLSLLGAAFDDPANEQSGVCKSLDFGLLVSHMNGQLATFDMRYVSSKAGSRGNEPVVLYGGHVNTHTRELGLAIDHTTDFLYAAGQDCRIRGWSLTTGESIAVPKLCTPTPSPSVQTGTPPEPWSHTHPFSTTFNEPIPVLRVSGDDSVESGGRGGGRCLWAAGGDGLWRWNLGQRSVGGSRVVGRWQ